MGPVGRTRTVVAPIGRWGCAPPGGRRGESYAEPSRSTAVRRAGRLPGPQVEGQVGGRWWPATREGFAAWHRLPRLHRRRLPSVAGTSVLRRVHQNLRCGSSRYAAIVSCSGSNLGAVERMDVKDTVPHDEMTPARSRPSPWTWPVASGADLRTRQRKTCTSDLDAPGEGWPA